MHGLWMHGLLVVGTWGCLGLSRAFFACLMQRGIQEVDMEEDDSTVQAGRAHSGEDGVPDALKASRCSGVLRLRVRV